MFRDSVDAFAYVIREKKDIKHVSANAGCLRNGINHCRVQIECADGAAYGIDAYGEEADRLLAEAKRYLAKIEVMATV